MHGRGYQTSSIGPPLTPPVVQHLMIANLAVFVLQICCSAVSEIVRSGPSGYYMWQAGHLWEPFTYMWLHGGLGHLAMNMFALWMFGSQLALAWGPRRSSCASISSAESVRAS